ncbi:MAG: flagellar FlbD family protein [Victivallales bacterium]|nr:flagellar FlbD family protein [Victivallales bacterium]
MIWVTDLKGNKTRLHAMLIREIRKSPDTVLILTNGNSLIVRESVDDIVDMMAGKRNVFNS